MQGLHIRIPSALPGLAEEARHVLAVWACASLSEPLVSGLLNGRDNTHVRGPSKPARSRGLHQKEFSDRKRGSRRVLLWKAVGRAGFAGATWVRPVGRDGGASGGQAGRGICCRTLRVHRPPTQGFRGANKAANQRQETGTSTRGPGSPPPTAPQQAHPSPNTRAAGPSISHPGADIHKSH